MRTIEIDVDVYIDLLNERRTYNEVHFGWNCPDCVWDYVMKSIKENGVPPKKSDPKYIVDNLIVNGDYSDIDNCKNGDETDEQYVERMLKEGETIKYFPEERIVLFGLGF